MLRTLCLNADLSFLSVLDHFTAMVHILEGKAEMASHYDPKQQLRSQFLSFPIPSVIIMKKYKVLNKKNRNMSCSKKVILMRDNYICCYCGKKVTMATGNRDHVIPISHKPPGKTVMSNLVCSCLRCNNLKNDRTPAQAGMKMLYQPRETLDNSDRISLIVKSVSSKERNNWLDYLNENSIKLY